MAEWSRVVNTTISDYVRGEEVNIMRNRKLLALLKTRGRISMNHSGESITKRVRYKRAPMVGYADGDTLTFTRRDRWKTTKLDWRGYAMTDAATKKETLMNKSKEQIIDIYSEVGKGLMDDINDEFGEEFYIDGNASGNTKRIHGIESFFGNAGISPAGYVALPHDTYADLATDLGQYGGAWTQDGSGNSTWPTGSGDAHYDFWSPTIVAYDDSHWAATTDNWANNCLEVLRYGIIKSARNKTKTGQLDYIQLESELFRLYCDARESIQQIFVTPGSGEGQANLVSLGFADVTYYDGCQITWEYGMPLDTGYGLNVDQMELMSLQKQLFVVVGPDYDAATCTYRTSIDMYGNLWCNPRYQCKWLKLG